MEDLIIGGFLPVTTIDFPGRLASVVFCQGCMWRCFYCHNVDLQPMHGKKELVWSDVLNKIKSRKHLVESIVFSGGEPLMQPVVEQAIKQVKSLGLKVGLHTNGVRLELFKKVLPMIDWVGLDIKTRFSEYEKITEQAGSGEIVRQSLQVLIDSGVDYETRTTISPNVHTVDTILAMAEEIAAMGVETFALQAYKAVDMKQSMLEYKNAQFFSQEVTDRMNYLFKNFIERR